MARVTSITTKGAHTRNATLNSVQTAAVPEGANVIIMQGETQSIRYTLDGTTPTATVGFLLAAGADPLLVPVPVNGSVKFLETAVNAVINYQFVKV